MKPLHPQSSASLRPDDGAAAPPFDWSGRPGEIWRDNQEMLDRMLAPCGAAALRAAAPAAGERVLDVGCGAGASSLALAAQVGSSGQVLGLDISEPLLSRARERTPPGVPITYRLGDAAAEPLPRGAFDLLFSRFGVMFFPDPAAAFRHLRTALAPTGRLAFVCWRRFDENDWVRLLMSAVAEILPSLTVPAPETPGPFAFGDPARVRQILAVAGFRDVRLEPYDCALVYGEASTAEDAVDAALELSLRVGPLSRALAEQPPELRERAARAVREALRQRVAGHVVTLGGACWIVTARA